MAQNKKITQLNPLSQASGNDLFPIVDVGAFETKKITAGELFASPQPIGITAPSSAVFTSLSLGGNAVSEFSIDGTLGGDSNATIPTEKAIKTYVDTAISILSPNKIGQGNSSIEVVDLGTGSILSVVDTFTVSTMTVAGLRLQNGTRINEFSNDTTLGGASSTAVPTEYAVKTYVDMAITGRFYDSTDAGALVFIDSTGGLEVSKPELNWSNKTLNTNSTFTTLGTFDNAYGLRSAVKISNSSLYQGHVYGHYIEVDSPSGNSNGVGSLYGLLVDNIKNSITSCDSQVGLSVNVTAGAGTQTSLYGGQFYLDTSASLINSVVGLDIALNGLGHISGDAVALKINGKEPGSVTGNSYSILVEGVSSKVKFLGSLEMASSFVSINEFSNDITLISDSPTALVTEHAVKTYIDSLGADSSNKIYQGHSIVEAIDNTSNSGVFISAHNQVLSDSTSSTTTTFRFDKHTTTNWIDPAKMVDNSLITYSRAGFASGTYTQINSSNTADTTSHIGTITKVELRINSAVGVGSVTSFDLTPIFNGVNYGSVINILGVSGWSSYFDITADSNAPGLWTWEDVNKLDTRVKVVIGAPGGGAQDYAQVRFIEIRVTYLNQHYIDGASQVGKFDKYGLTLEFGASVKEFSTDFTLGGNSDIAVPTEKAIKTYVDDQIDYVINHLDLMTVRMIFSDSTAESGDIIISDSPADVAITMMPKEDGKYVVKNLSTKKVTLLPYTGTIDGQSTLIIDAMFRSVTLASNGANFYII